MNPIVSLDGTIGWIVLATPFVILAITAAAVFWSSTRGGRGEADIEFDSRETRTTATQAALTGAEASSTDAVSFESHPRERLGDGLTAPGSRTAIESAIAAAGADGDREQLSELFLALGILERDAGKSSAAAELFRTSIGLAAETGQAVVHARGRLELGDLSCAAGDLSTACEHWQMARALFEEVGLAAPKAEAEGRMQRNGCPTDWVLTDF